MPIRNCGKICRLPAGFLAENQQGPIIVPLVQDTTEGMIKYDRICSSVFDLRWIDKEIAGALGKVDLRCSR